MEDQKWAINAKPERRYNHHQKNKGQKSVVLQGMGSKPTDEPTMWENYY